MKANTETSRREFLAASSSLVLAGSLSALMRKTQRRPPILDSLSSAVQRRCPSRCPDSSAGASRSVNA